jgi:hypothetical protein
VTCHQNVPTALEHWTLRYLNSRTYEELENNQVMDVAIDETGIVSCNNVGMDELSPKKVEELIIKEIKEVLDYLLEVYGVPPGWKGEGITRLICKNQNWLQSTLLKKKEKLEKAQRVINNLQANIVCYNEH